MRKMIRLSQENEDLTQKEQGQLQEEQKEQLQDISSDIPRLSAQEGLEKFIEENRIHNLFAVQDDTEKLEKGIYTFIKEIDPDAIQNGKPLIKVIYDEEDKPERIEIPIILYYYDLGNENIQEQVQTLINEQQQGKIFVFVVERPKVSKKRPSKFDPEEVWAQVFSKSETISGVERTTPENKKVRYMEHIPKELATLRGIIVRGMQVPGYYFRWYTSRTSRLNFWYHPDIVGHIKQSHLEPTTRKTIDMGGVRLPFDSSTFRDIIDVRQRASRALGLIHRSDLINVLTQDINTILSLWKNSSYTQEGFVSTHFVNQLNNFYRKYIPVLTAIMNAVIGEEDFIISYEYVMAKARSILTSAMGQGRFDPSIKSEDAMDVAAGPIARDIAGYIINLAVRSATYYAFSLLKEGESKKVRVSVEDIAATPEVEYTDIEREIDTEDTEKSNIVLPNVVTIFRYRRGVIDGLLSKLTDTSSSFNDSSDFYVDSLPGKEEVSYFDLIQRALLEKKLEEYNEQLEQADGEQRQEILQKIHNASYETREDTKNLTNEIVNRLEVEFKAFLLQRYSALPFIMPLEVSDMASTVYNDVMFKNLVKISVLFSYDIVSENICPMCLSQIQFLDRKRRTCVNPQCPTYKDVGILGFVYRAAVGAIRAAVPIFVRDKIRQINMEKLSAREQGDKLKVLLLEVEEKVLSELPCGLTMLTKIKSEDIQTPVSEEELEEAELGTKGTRYSSRTFVCLPVMDPKTRKIRYIWYPKYLLPHMKNIYLSVQELEPELMYDFSNTVVDNMYTVAYDADEFFYSTLTEAFMSLGYPVTMMLSDAGGIFGLYSVICIDKLHQFISQADVVNSLLAELYPQEFYESFGEEAKITGEKIEDVLSLMVSDKERSKEVMRKIKKKQAEAKVVVRQSVITRYLNDIAQYISDIIPYIINQYFTDWVIMRPDENFVPRREFNSLDDLEHVYFISGGKAYNLPIFKNLQDNIVQYTINRFHMHPAKVDREQLYRIINDAISAYISIYRTWKEKGHIPQSWVVFNVDELMRYVKDKDFSAEEKRQKIEALQRILLEEGRLDTWENKVVAFSYLRTLFSNLVENIFKEKSISDDFRQFMQENKELSERIKTVKRFFTEINKIIQRKHPLYPVEEQEAPQDVEALRAQERYFLMHYLLLLSSGMTGLTKEQPSQWPGYLSIDDLINELLSRRAIYYPPGGSGASPFKSDQMLPVSEEEREKVAQDIKVIINNLPFVIYDLYFNERNGLYKFVRNPNVLVRNFIRYIVPNEVVTLFNNIYKNFITRIIYERALEEPGVTILPTIIAEFSDPYKLAADLVMNIYNVYNAVKSSSNVSHQELLSNHEKFAEVIYDSFSNKKQCYMHYCPHSLRQQAINVIKAILDNFRAEEGSAYRTAVVLSKKVIAQCSKCYRMLVTDETGKKCKYCGEDVVYSQDQPLISFYDRFAFRRNRMIRKASSEEQFNIIKICDDRISREIGFMHYKGEITNRDCMLFIFDEPGEYLMWNHNVPFDLDVVFCDSDGVVTYKCRMRAYSRKVCGGIQGTKYVVEGLAGSMNKIRIGDKLNIDYHKNKLYFS